MPQSTAPWLNQGGQKVVHSSKVRHTIKLIGELKLEAAVPLLTELLNDGTLYANEIIEAPYSGVGTYRR